MDYLAYQCFNFTGELMIKCVENGSYSSDEIFVDSKMSKNVQTFFTDGPSGLVHSFHAKMKHNIKLNPNMTYRMIIVDKKLELTSLNPDIFPRSILMLKQNTGHIIIYLKVNTYN